MKLKIPKRKAGLLERETGDAVVLMTENGTIIYTLQHTALFIWGLIDGHNSIEMIVKKLLDEFDTTLNTATADVVSFLKSLQENEIIEIE